jgi:hypothetical protein
VWRDTYELREKLMRRRVKLLPFSSRERAHNLVFLRRPLSVTEPFYSVPKDVFELGESFFPVVLPEMVLERFEHAEKSTRGCFDGEQIDDARHVDECD